jgi:hypothetical protein
MEQRRPINYHTCHVAHSAEIVLGENTIGGGMALHDVKDRVERMLTDFVGMVQLHPDGHYTFDYNSVKVFVTVFDWPEANASCVRVHAVLLWEVPGSAELFEEIATSALNYRFGALSLFKCDDGSYNVNFGHTLLGDTLDPDELRHAVGAVAITADQLDDQLKAKYGGTRWADLKQR